jgi:hypothetical protein
MRGDPGREARGYVALIHGGLLNRLVETVRFGPES